MNIVYLLRDSTTHVAILREACYNGWKHQYITTVCEARYRSEMLSFKNAFQYRTLKSKIQINLDLF